MSDREIIEEAIRLVGEGVSVSLPVNGQSMLPFIIGGRESVILAPPKVRVGAIVLAWVDGCRFVVHRIIRIEGETVTLMGDGNVAGMEQCRVSDVKAVATHVLDTRQRPHFLYTRWRLWAAKLWWRLLPVRRYLLAIYRRL